MNINPIFPSILSTNFFNLQDKLAQMQASGIDFIHLDIMDGHFVDNISFGPSMLKAVREQFDFSFDTHLMVSNPGKIIQKFIQAESDWISFHLETAGIENVLQNIRLIKKHNKKAGLVLNPDTAIQRLREFLPYLDYVLLMSVYPGYGGQTFITDTLDRVKELKKLINEESPSCLIQVDGGINAEIAGQLARAGADLFVIGTYLFNSDNILDTINKIRQQCEGDKT